MAVNNINQYCNLVVQRKSSIVQTLRKMDEAKHKMLLVYDGDVFYSIVTIGDLQRAIINNVDLNSPIEQVIDKNAKEYASSTDSDEEVRGKMLAIRAEFMPIIDSNGKLTRIYFWEDFFSNSIVGEQRELIDLPVVIMAGGKGTRLKPLTNIIPKPLIPIGEKTILETIMDQFESIGCKKFYISVNYKDDMLRYYMSTLEHEYSVEYFKEEQPMGTIGSISLLKDKKFASPFFVSNCDILIDQDYRDVYDYHRKNCNDITIITSIKSYKIPYGVIETGKDGIMLGLTEKPEMTYMINTGVYILQPDLINEIPSNQFYHITQLIESVRERGGRVGCFPVSEKSWTDMGDWEEYLKIIRK